MSTLIAFEKLANARDLGGMKTTDGRKIVKGKLIRCEQLAGLTPSDKAKLEGLLDTVVDFRNTEEAADQPDCVLAGVKYISNPILESFTAGVSREEKSDEELIANLVFRPEDAKEYMRSMYRKFVTDFCISRYARFTNILLEEHDKAVLWHCSAGKDRAGIGSVVIEEILGVPREAIIADYLKTRDYVAQYTEGFVRFIRGEISKEKKLSEEESEIVGQSVRNLFGVDRSYIEAYYEAIDKRYGDYAIFIREGLGLSEEQINQLKDKYLE